MDRWEAELLIKTLAGGEDPELGDTIVRGEKEWHFGRSGAGAGGCGEYYDIGEIEDDADLELDFSYSNNIKATLLGNVRLVTPKNYSAGCTYHVLFVMQSTVTVRLFTWNSFWYWPDGAAELSLEAGDKDLIWGTADSGAMYCFILNNLHTSTLTGGDVQFIGSNALTLTAELLFSGTVTFSGTIGLQTFSSLLQYTPPGGLNFVDEVVLIEDHSIVDTIADVITKLEYMEFSETLVRPIIGRLLSAVITLNAKKLPAGVFRDVMALTEAKVVSDVATDIKLILEHITLSETKLGPPQVSVAANSIWFSGTKDVMSLTAGLSYAEPVIYMSFWSEKDALEFTSIVYVPVDILPPTGYDAIYDMDYVEVTWSLGESGVKTEVWRDEELVYTTDVDVVSYTDWFGGLGDAYKLRHQDPNDPNRYSPFTSTFYSRAP